MNPYRASKTIDRAFSNVAILTVILGVMLGTASAREHKSKVSGAQSLVVAHISFTGFSNVDMAMSQQVRDKRYLYIQHSKDEGISIVDVSQPEKAKIIGVTPWPNPSVSSHMNVMGDLALISETGVRQAVNSGASSYDLVLWDLSNPTSPKVVKRFSGVIKLLEDNRNFVYVLNSEGLWVISMPDRQSEQLETSAYGG